MSQNLQRISLLLIVFMCCLFACNEKKLEKKVQYSASLRAKEDFIIRLDEYSPHDVFCMQFFSLAQKQFLFVLNHLVNKIYVYSYPNGQIMQVINIPREGPNSIPQVSGFFVHNLDSIFVFPKGNLHQTRLVNQYGDFFKIDMSGARWEDSGFVNAVSITTSPTIYEDGVLYFVQYPVGFEMPDDQRCSYPYLAAYDMKADSMFSFPIYRYPKNLCGKEWPFWGHMPKRVMHNQKQIINWPWSEELLVLERDGRIKKKEAKISTAEVSLPSYIPEEGEQKEVAYMLSTLTYKYLYYDPIERVYYRLGYMPIRYEPDKHFNYQAFDDQPITITLLDEKFEKIGEERLPARTYSGFTGFAYAGTFCLSKANHYNVGIKEDALPFGCFSLIRPSHGEVYE